MPAQQRKEQVARAGECRRCASFCDKMVEPRACIEMRCRYVYSYVDMLTGDEFVGCMQKVFAAEVEVEAALEKGGFGGVKMTGDPLPQCQFRVEQAYEGVGPSYDCVNMRFFDCTDQGPEGLRAFDLRNALPERPSGTV